MNRFISPISLSAFSSPFPDIFTFRAIWTGDTEYNGNPHTFRWIIGLDFGVGDWWSWPKNSNPNRKATIIARFRRYPAMKGEHFQKGDSAIKREICCRVSLWRAEPW